jgi:phosphoglycolate phosphatase
LSNDKNLLIFDLDGTLIDSKLDLAHAVNAARAHMGLPPIENETVYSYVGDGAPILLRRAMGPDAPQADVDRALAYFLEYYRAHMLDNTTPYPGVREALDRLAQQSRTMAILTNKPVRISNAILEGLGIAGHFRFVYGGNSFEFKKPNPIGIETLLDETGAPRASALMIGDSGVDVQTARNASIEACGVTYGFQPETFVQYPPDFLIDTIGELVPLARGRRLK